MKEFSESTPSHTVSIIGDFIRVERNAVPYYDAGNVLELSAAQLEELIPVLQRAVGCSDRKIMTAV
jgi:hypothetical protein